MKEAKDALGGIVNNMFEKWGDSRWFKGLVIAIVIYLMLAPILTPLVTHYVQNINMPEQINSILNERDNKTKEEHQIRYNNSLQAYSLAKHTMQEYIDKIDAEYIFLLEYHNGSENIVTGIQFCRFDVSIEVSENTAAYVPLEKFKDDIVARYDLLLNEELAQKNKILYFRQPEFEKVDKYLAYQLTTVNAQSYAILNLRDRSGAIFGSVLCVSTDNDYLNLVRIHELAGELEDIFMINE